MRGDPLATDQSQPTSHHTSHFTTSQTRTSHFTPTPVRTTCRPFMLWTVRIMNLPKSLTFVPDDPWHVTHFAGEPGCNFVYCSWYSRNCLACSLMIHPSLSPLGGKHVRPYWVLVPCTLTTVVERFRTMYYFWWSNTTSNIIIWLVDMVVTWGDQTYLYTGCWESF